MSKYRSLLRQDPLRQQAAEMGHLACLLEALQGSQESHSNTSDMPTTSVEHQDLTDHDRGTVRLS
jgi:hypothetical protein